MDIANIPLKWIGEEPDAETIALVRQDIIVSLTSLAKVSDLIMHTVLLGDDYDGPSVHLWSEECDDSAFF